VVSLKARAGLGAEVAFPCDSCKKYHLDSNLRRIQNGIVAKRSLGTVGCCTLPSLAVLHRLRYLKGVVLMTIINRKWWLTAMALLLLAPVASAAVLRPKPKPLPPPPLRRCNVPEGGSALVYVLGAGVTCLGAMVVRSRSARPEQS